MGIGRALLLARLVATAKEARGKARGLLWAILLAAGLGVTAAPSLAAPGAPILELPPDGAQLTDFGVTLTWANPTGTTQYYLEVLPAPGVPAGPPDGPAVTLVRNTETGFTLLAPRIDAGNYVLLPDMTYTWLVSASDSQTFAPPGDPSYGPAGRRTFRTPAVSSTGISNVQPGDGAAVESVTPLLRWENSDQRVFYYEVQLSRDPNFVTGPNATAPVYWELVHGGVTSPLNSYQVKPQFALLGNTPYFWRVRPRVQGDGRPVAWSRTFWFTTPEPQVRLERAFGDRAFAHLTNLAQPDGRYFVTEQAGVVRVFHQDQEQVGVFLDIRDRVLTSHTEEGLLGMAFDPSFRSNGTFYLYYSAASPRRNVLSRFTASREDPGRADAASEVIILEFPKPYGNHNGGQLAFGPDGYLYVAVGDGGGAGDPAGNAQDLGSPLGKIHRIDVRDSPPEGYRIPDDNPFAGLPDARGEIWAYGLRNPWRFSFDRDTGALWTGDVGESQWEEVDRVVKGGNYGWNIQEGSHCYSPRAGCNATGLEQPLAEYSHDEGCSVTGGYVYRGAAAPSLRGAYLYGDFCSGKIWGLWVDGEGAARTALLLESGLSISSFGEDVTGEVYVLDWDAGIYRFRE